jgi:hypothetical protein
MHPTIKTFLEEPGLSVADKQTILRRAFLPFVRRVTKFIKATRRKPSKEWLMVRGRKGYEGLDIPMDTKQTRINASPSAEGMSDVYQQKGRRQQS